MATGFQRERSNVSADQRLTLLEKVVIGLDSDERLIFPHLYLDNKRMYDQISGVAYLIKEDHPDAELDWVWESGLERLRNNGCGINVLAKVLIVRIRLPWNSVRYEWLCSQQELDDSREDFCVIDIFIKARDKENPSKVILADPLEFEKNRDRFEVVEVRYLVAWKDTRRYSRQLLTIDPERIHTYMQQ